MILDGYVIANVIEVLRKSESWSALKLDDREGFERNYCPRCFKGGEMQILYGGQKYCSVCGQHIGYPAIRESEAEY